MNIKIVFLNRWVGQSKLRRHEIEPIHYLAYQIINYNYNYLNVL